MEPEGSLPCSQVPFTGRYPEPELIQRVHPGPRFLVVFPNKIFCYGEELLSSGPTSKLEDHLLSAVRYCFPPYLEVVSSIRNLRTRHAVVKSDPPNMY
jgi:hypothetical protein